MVLSAEQMQSWDDNGYIKLKGFADQATLDAMIGRIAAIARSIAAGDERPDLLVTEEHGYVWSPPDPSIMGVFASDAGE